MSHRAAIVGLGSITARPARASLPAVLGAVWPHRHAPAYALLPQVEVVAVCDLKADLLRQFEAQWRATWPGVRGYADARTS